LPEKNLIYEKEVIIAFSRHPRLNTIQCSRYLQYCWTIYLPTFPK